MINIAYVEKKNSNAADDWSSIDVVEILGYHYNDVGDYFVLVYGDDKLVRLVHALDVKVAIVAPVVFDAWCDDCRYDNHVCPWCKKQYAHDGSDLDDPTADDHIEVCPELQSRNSVR